MSATRDINQYTVPTAKMRNGDFSEVARAQPELQNLRSADRESRRLGSFGLPGRHHSCQPDQRHLQAHPGEVSRAERGRHEQWAAEQLPGVPRFPKAIRDNYDGKINWNRNAAHQFWAKASVMQADVLDLFYLPFENAGGGETTVSLWTIGQTWTLTPTLLLDANGGSNKMTHQSNGPDYGTNYGTDVFGIPGLNADGVTGPGSADLQRYSGMPVINTGLSALGNDSAWTPVWRKEISYTASVNMTKGCRQARDPRRDSTSCG